MPVPEGGTYDITVYQGAPFRQTFALREDDETTVITLNGFDAEGQIRPRPGSDTLIAELTCEVDGDAGEVTISLTKNTTDGISMSGEYDVFLDNGLPDDRVMFMEGKMTFNPKVTA